MNANEWRTVTLEQVAADRKWAINGGPFGSELTRRHYADAGVPVIRGVNLAADGRFDATEFVFVSEEKADELIANNAHPGDVIVTQRGTLGQVGLIPFGVGHDRFVISQSQMKITVDDAIADPVFVYYALRSPETVARIQNLGISTGVPHINLAMFRTFTIALPSPPIQRKIAAVLSAFDDLIENNLRRIAILEEMAGAIYREWFVEFRFPGHERVAKVESELGPIPEGWEVVRFGDLATCVRDGVDPSSLDPSIPYVGLEHIPRGSITLRDWGRASDVTSGKFRFEEGDVLFGKLRPYFHKVVEAPMAGVCSTDAMVLRARTDLRDLVLWCASSPGFVAHAAAGAGGTDRPRASWESMGRYLIPLAPAKLLAAFSTVVRPMVDLMKTLVRSLNVVRDTRNLLLPRLISGQLDVSGLDIDTGGVGA